MPAPFAFGAYGFAPVSYRPASQPIRNALCLAIRKEKTLTKPGKARLNVAELRRAEALRSLIDGISWPMDGTILNRLHMGVSGRRTSLLAIGLAISVLAPQTPAIGMSDETRIASASIDIDFGGRETVLPQLPGMGQDDALIEPDVVIPELPDVAEELGFGVASWYGSRFAGRPTASGERFDPTEYTAAHRTLPFGSRVRVSSPRTGKSIIVRINDRGPFHGKRVIDLSEAAADAIGLKSRGADRVQLALLAD